MAANAAAQVMTFRGDESPRTVRRADHNTHGIRKYAIYGR